MSHPKIGRTWAFALSLLACSLGTSASALMVEKPLSELTSDSLVVVEGRVASVKSEVGYDSEEAGIVTNVDIEILDVVKGDWDRTGTVTVQVLGGELPERGLGLVVSDQPRFELGETVVVFLKDNAPKNALSVVGNFQGKMTVSGSKVRYKEAWVDRAQFLRRVRSIAEGAMDLE